MKVRGFWAMASLVLMISVVPKAAEGWQNCVAALAEGDPSDPQLERNVREFWMRRFTLVDQIEKLFPVHEHAKRVLFSVGVNAVRNREIAEALETLEGLIQAKLSLKPGTTMINMGFNIQVRDEEYEPKKVAVFDADGTMRMVDEKQVKPVRRLIPFVTGDDDGHDKPAFYVETKDYKQQYLPRTVQMSLRRMLVVLAASNGVAPHEEIVDYFRTYFMADYRTLAMIDDVARKVLAEYEKGEESLEALWERIVPAENQDEWEVLP